MPDELNTPVETAPSEQPTVAESAPVVPSEQGQVAESSPAPAAEAPKAPEKKTPEVDLDAIRKQVAEELREKARHEAQSEFGKKASELKRQLAEQAAREREQLLTEVSNFVPDDTLKAMRSQYTEQQRLRQTAEEAEQAKAELAQWRQYAQVQEEARKASALAEQAGYNISELPTDVKGDSPIGFHERFSGFLAKEVQKLKKQSESAAKKAAEEAVRETERRLGVTAVTGATPSGSGGGDLASLRAKLRQAYDRNDSSAIETIGRQIEEEVYRRG